MKVYCVSNACMYRVFDEHSYFNDFLCFIMMDWCILRFLQVRTTNTAIIWINEIFFFARIFIFPILATAFVANNINFPSVKHTWKEGCLRIWLNVIKWIIRAITRYLDDLYCITSCYTYTEWLDLPETLNQRRAERALFLTHKKSRENKFRIVSFESWQTLSLFAAIWWKLENPFSKLIFHEHCNAITLFLFFFLSYSNNTDVASSAES